VGGTKRAVRLAEIYLALLAALYVGFVLYDRAIPGGTSSGAESGMVLFSGIFVLFAVAGAVYTLHPAPRAVEVASDHVTVVGRWGRHRRLPRLELLTVNVVRRYPPGWLADTPVELIELWGEDTPSSSYLADPELFSGAASSLRRG
jgi:hypothetical protein